MVRFLLHNIRYLRYCLCGLLKFLTIYINTKHYIYKEFSCYFVFSLGAHELPVLDYGSGSR